MTDLPVVVIGAGPTGLATAAHLRARGRGRDTVVLEAGETAAAGVRSWSHVRLFSPWSELVDPAAAELLAETGWQHPDGQAYPTGAQWADLYLQPLADALGVVRCRSRVTGVARRGRDLVVDAGRDDEPFTVHVDTPDGQERLLASAVVDASGTYASPNPLGGDGLTATGEAAATGRIAYAVPDLRAPGVAARYAGKHVALAGSGHSAMTVLLELSRIAEQAPGTQVSWLVRRPSTAAAFGGGENDQLEARGALGADARAAVATGAVTTVTGFRTAEVVTDGDHLTLVSTDGQRVEGIDEVIAVTGFRPDLTMLSEVRLDLDPVLQAPRALAPLIDPNVHSCGTVYPHGAAELTQPETGLFVVGMKSYGRAPTFLALTGYEQVRSVVAALDGDHEAAARVDLVLPETGLCGGAGLFDSPDTQATDSGCCGVPATDAVLQVGGSTTVR